MACPPTNTLVSCRLHAAVHPPPHLQENQFLLGLGVSCVTVLVMSAVLMLCMRRSFEHERQLQAQVGRNLPAGTTAARTPQEKVKGCYINKGGPELQEMLKHTRPGEDACGRGGGAVEETVQQALRQQLLTSTVTD